MLYCLFQFKCMNLHVLRLTIKLCNVPNYHKLYRVQMRLFSAAQPTGATIHVRDDSLPHSCCVSSLSFCHAVARLCGCIFINVLKA